MADATKSPVADKSQGMEAPTSDHSRTDSSTRRSSDGASSRGGMSEKGPAASEKSLPPAKRTEKPPNDEPSSDRPRKMKLRAGPDLADPAYPAENVKFHFVVPQILWRDNSLALSVLLQEKKNAKYAAGLAAVANGFREIMHQRNQPRDTAAHNPPGNDRWPGIVQLFSSAEEKLVRRGRTNLQPQLFSMDKNGEMRKANSAVDRVDEGTSLQQDRSAHHEEAVADHLTRRGTSVTAESSPVQPVVEMAAGLGAPFAEGGFRLPPGYAYVALDADTNRMSFGQAKSVEEGGSAAGLRIRGEWVANYRPYVVCPGINRCGDAELVGGQGLSGEGELLSALSGGEMFFQRAMGGDDVPTVWVKNPRQ